MTTAGVRFEGQHLTELRPAVQDELFDVIMNSPSKSYQLDQLPMNMPKKVTRSHKNWNTKNFNLPSRGGPKGMHELTINSPWTDRRFSLNPQSEDIPRTIICHSKFVGEGKRPRSSSKPRRGTAFWLRVHQDCLSAAKHHSTQRVISKFTKLWR